MFFLSFLIKITNLVTNLFIVPFRPYIVTKIGNYNLAVPNYDNKSYIEDSKVYLLYSNNLRVDITQPPGTKYPYLPSDYGADSYIVVNKNDGKEVFIQDTISVNCTKCRRPRKILFQ